MGSRLGAGGCGEAHRRCDRSNASYWRLACPTRILPVCMILRLSMSSLGLFVLFTSTKNLKCKIRDYITHSTLA